MSAAFPTAGLDVTCEFGRQPSDTTPDSQNVRSVETIAERFRGGSRPGVSRYIDEQVSGTNLIQHLSVLVDPQQPGLRADIDPDFPDSSTNNLRPRIPPGRRIRLGGSGISPLGNDQSQQQSPADISFVQKKRAFLGADIFEVTLDQQPAINDLVIAIVNTAAESENADEPPPGPLVPGPVTTGAGAAFTTVGGSGYSVEYSRMVPGSKSNTVRLQVSYRIVQGTVDDQTVRVGEAGPGAYELVVLVYRNAAQGGPLSNFSKTDSQSAVSTQPTGSVAMNNTTGQMCLAVVSNLSVFTELSPETSAAGYVLRFGGPDLGTNVTVADRLHINTAAPESPVFVVAEGGDASPYGAILSAWTR